MRLTHAILVIADISGYTGFIRRREVSLLHAEQIVSDLIEALVSGAERPLILNKLEGDAALLYAESGPEPRHTAAAVLESLRAGFEAFRARLQAIRHAHRATRPPQDPRQTTAPDACVTVPA